MKTILLCISKLNTSKASSHVVTLSKELANIGYNVVIASNGGELEHELRGSSIMFEQIPLHSKLPHCVIESLIKLRKIIKKYKPDIVHVHDELSGACAFILKKHYNNNLIVTTHDVPDSSWFLRKINEWGCYIFVTSKELKTKLLNKYVFYPDTVIEIKDGVNLNDWQAPVITNNQTTNNQTAKTIIHISKLDKRSSNLAYMLIEYAKTTSNKIIIVGNGREVVNLKLKARGSNNIVFVEDANNLSELFKSAVVFIGDGRDVLAAMAMNIPVIMANDYRYLGIIDEYKASDIFINESQARLEVELSYEKLKSDLDYIINNKNDNSWQRKFVEKNYSLTNMVSDYEVYYKKVHTSCKARAFVIGYYGVNNLGDNMLLEETNNLLLRSLPAHQIKILSYNTKQTEIIHKIKAVSRNNFFNIIRTVYQADVLVGGGGSLLQNATSNRSLYYYLAIIRAALMFNKKIALIGNGIGPIYGNIQTKTVKQTLSKVDYLHIRDLDSYNWIGGENKNSVELGADLVLNKSVDSKLFNAEKNKKVVINLRQWQKTAVLELEMLEFVQRLNSDGFEVVCVSMQEQFDADAMKKLGISKSFVNTEDLLTELSTAQVVIGMRLHSLIASAILHIPFIGLAYDPKVSVFCRQMGMPCFDNLQMLKAEDLLATFNETVDSKQDKTVLLSEKVQAIQDSNKNLAINISNLLNS